MRGTLTPLILALLSACAQEVERVNGLGRPIERLIGEAHLHQFPAGAHAWAQFISPPWSVGELHGDGLVHLDTIPSATEGPCVLYIMPTCRTGCAGASYCAGQDLCGPIPPVRNIDGGEIQVRGSTVQPLIRMWWSKEEAGYQSEPPPGPAALFAGGERLSVRGHGGLAEGITGELPAAILPVLLSPPADAPLPAAGPLTVAWEPAGAQAMVLRVSASRQDGRSAYIRCVIPDSGGFSVSSRLLAGLPPPPRRVRLELDRAEDRILPTRQEGIGFVVHTEYTAWRVTDEVP